MMFVERKVLIPILVFSLNVAVIAGIVFWPARTQSPLPAFEPRFAGGWKLPDRPVKILTFNIDNGKRLEEALELIRREDADIVCMQEMNPEIFGTIEAGIGMKGTWYPASNQVTDTRCCKAIFTKGRLTEAQSIPNPHGGSFGLWAAVEIYGGRFLVGSIHLMDLRDTQAGYPTRRREIGALIDALDKVKAPALFAGDFNNPPSSVNYEQLTSRLTDLSAGPGVTHPDWLPIVKIDYVFATEEWEGVSAKKIRTTISDHYPVVVVAKAKKSPPSTVHRPSPVSRPTGDSGP